MKILIYGAGVVGSYYAAQLHEAGHDVSVLARGQRLGDIREFGIVLESVDTGQRAATPVKVVEQLTPEDAYDLVMVVMRKNQVPAVLPQLAANPHTPNVLFVGNNAAGADELVTALGHERVLMGFGGVGGIRKAHIIRYLTGTGRRKAPVTIGELDGSTTARLEQIVAAFARAGISVEISPDIDAWLKTHVALVGPLAGALAMAGGDNYRLARTRDAVVLAVRAIREGFQVLRGLGIPVLPTRFRFLERVPEPILVRLLMRRLNSEAAEVALAGHARAAPDEMRHMTAEFMALARSSATPTPALTRLYAYLDPGVSAIPEGSAEIPLDWSAPLWMALTALAGGLFVARRRRARRRH